MNLENLHKLIDKQWRKFLYNNITKEENYV